MVASFFKKKKERKWAQEEVRLTDFGPQGGLKGRVSQGSGQQNEGVENP